MKHLFISFIALTILFFFASCAEDIKTDKGTLQIVSLETQMNNVEVLPLTRAISPELNVDIYDETGSEIIVQLPAGRTNSSVQLDAGNYLLKAYSNNWNTIYDNEEKGEAKYYAELQFTIEAGKVKSVKLVVPMTNIAVSYTLPEGFDTWFSQHTFTIADAGNTRSLQPQPGEVCYYDCDEQGKLTLNYSLQATNVDYETFESEGAITASAGVHYTVEYSYEPSSARHLEVRVIQ